MNLSEEVLKYYGLKDDPWRDDIRADSDVFETKDFLGMRKLIFRAIERRSFAMISGTTGSGKSQMCRRVIRLLLKRGRVKLVQILAPNVKKIDASTVCDALIKNLAPKDRPEVRTEKLAIQVCDVLIEHHKQGNVPVLLIDDAHKCLPSTLSQLKKFHELRDVTSDRPYDPLMTIILLGWPELSVTLQNNATLLEISRRCEMLALVGLKGEIDDYVKKKLARVGGGGRTIFGTAAFQALKKVSQAQWPLAVNLICSQAMYNHWHTRKTRKLDGPIQADDVRRAAEEVV